MSSVPWRVRDEDDKLPLESSARILPFTRPVSSVERMARKLELLRARRPYRAFLIEIMIDKILERREKVR